MYIARVPNRSSPPAILLRESYRVGGQVKTRTLANLSRWSEAKIQALSRVLKDQPSAAPAERFEIERALPHRHIARCSARASSASPACCRTDPPAWPSSPWR